MQMEEQVLRALHGERRDHQHAARFERLIDRALQHLAARADVLVHAVAIGGFDQAVIRRRDLLRRLDKRRWHIAKVAREHDRLSFDFNVDDRRSENMSCVIQFDFERADLDGLVIAYSLPKSRHFSMSLSR